MLYADGLIQPECSSSMNSASNLDFFDPIANDLDITSLYFSAEHTISFWSPNWKRLDDFCLVIKPKIIHHSLPSII